MATSIFHPAALEEMREARDFYESRRAGLGYEFRLAVERTVAWLEQNPEVCAVDELGVRTLSVGRFPFAVYFHFAADVVSIIAVAHQSREPYYWRERLEP